MLFTVATVLRSHLSLTLRYVIHQDNIWPVHQTDKGLYPNERQELRAVLNTFYIVGKQCLESKWQMGIVFYLLLKVHDAKLTPTFQLFSVWMVGNMSFSCSSKITDPTKPNYLCTGMVVFEKYISYMKPVYQTNWYTAQNYILLCYSFIKIQK